MRALQEFVEKAQFAQQLERRGMDGVAAEIAEEIGVFLKNKRVAAGTGE